MIVMFGLLVISLMITIVYIIYYSLTPHPIVSNHNLFNNIATTLEDHDVCWEVNSKKNKPLYIFFKTIKGTQHAAQWSYRSI